jgi:hypothetical protein
MWPTPQRVLWPVALSDASDILAKYGFESYQEFSLKLSALTDHATLYSIAVDAGRPDVRAPAPLLPTDDKTEWVLPVIPSPSLDTALMSITNEIEWRRRILEIVLDSGFDVIFDVGVPLAPRMIVHNDVFNFADRIVVLIRYAWELEKLPSMFGKMTDKTTIVLVGSEIAPLQIEASRRFPSVLMMPHDDKIADLLNRDGFLTQGSSRKANPYLSLLTELVEAE